MIQIFLRKMMKFFALSIESDPRSIRKEVIPGIDISGTRSWFLISSCLIASIGLNTNSQAVIIGAMLISPLMGPILGLGYSFAANDRELLGKSFKNIVFATFFSLSVSSLYFLISPFKDATSEILSRTSPTLLDLFVAIAAALAGIISIVDKRLSASFAGVAIATAIMPPLCAAGYGIAILDWRIFLGAFYLYITNAVAIATVAFLLFKKLHVNSLSFIEDDVSNKQDNVRRISKPIFLTLVLIFIIPLVWTMGSLWLNAQRSLKITRLVQSYSESYEIVKWNYDKSYDNVLKRPTLTVYSFKEFNPDEINQFEHKLHEISSEVVLRCHHSTSNADIELRNYIRELKDQSPLALLSDPDKLLKLKDLLTEKTSVISGEVIAPDVFKSLKNAEEKISFLLPNNGPKFEIFAKLVTNNSIQIIVFERGDSLIFGNSKEEKKTKFLKWLNIELNSQIEIDSILWLDSRIKNSLDYAAVESLEKVFP